MVDQRRKGKGALGKTSGRSIFQDAPLRATSSVLKKSMSCAIANALTTGGGRTVGWVGFALGRKLLPFGTFYADESISGFGKDFWKERFPQRLRGFYRRGYSTIGVGRNDSVPL